MKIKLFLMFFLIISKEAICQENDSSSIITLRFYLDRNCGFECARSYTDSQVFINGVLKKQKKYNYTVNNVQISKKMGVQNISSFKILNENPYKTFRFVIYDLDNKKFQDYVAHNFYREIIGLYKEYHTNGKIKLKGSYFKYDSTSWTNQNADIPRSSKDGIWITYDDNGKIIKKEIYDKGTLKDTIQL